MMNNLYEKCENVLAGIINVKGTPFHLQLR